MVKHHPCTLEAGPPGVQLAVLHFLGGDPGQIPLNLRFKSSVECG